MPNTKKKSLVSDLSTQISQTGNYILVDYTGLSHKTLEDVRKQVLKAGGTLRIVKNNLLLIALKDAKLPVSDDKLTGPTAVLIVPSGDPSSLKALQDKAKELDALPYKWGAWDGTLINDDKIKQIADLPSRDELIAKLVGQLKGPQTRLVFGLKGNLQKLTLALEAIRKQKETN